MFSVFVTDISSPAVVHSLFIYNHTLLIFVIISCAKWYSKNMMMLNGGNDHDTLNV